MEKIRFRFLFIFFLLFTSPWTWFDSIPGVTFLTNFYKDFNDWVVTRFNKYVFHLKDTLEPFNGSGDTSLGWGQFYTYLLLSFIGSLIWMLLDTKRQNYAVLNFWLRNIVRYFVAIVAFSYGIIKLFALQMPFPSLSALNTPLGDFLPMRLSWMFIGYSTTYQVFSGIMETLVGILLLNRKTVTLGSLLGLGVFSNIVMLNLSYDIPVKLFSIQLVLCCLFLTLEDWKRVFNFFLLNKPVEPNTSYDIKFTKRGQRIARILWKIGFVILFVIIPFKDSWEWYNRTSSRGELKPIKSGVYDIKWFVKNNDTMPVSVNDTMLWKDVIFDVGGYGSINSTDTLFEQWYRRGYFKYQPDTLNQTIAFKKIFNDSATIFVMHYQIPNDRTIRLFGKIDSDSLQLELFRSNRHFQLTERQFHWLSEANR
jgi:hypothetical protein